MRTLAGVGAELRRPGVSLLVSGVTLAIAMNAGTELIVTWIGRWPTVLGLLCLTVVVVGLARPFRALVLSRFQPRVVEIGGPVPGYRGLIVLASRGAGISSAEAAIRHHHAAGSLERCWIVTGGKDSATTAEGLIDRLRKDGIPMERFQCIPLKNEAEADNPVAVYRVIDRLFREADAGGISEEHIIGDYTGGTKSMTAGMILACAPPQRHLQFMKPRGYTADGRADDRVSSDAVIVDIRFELTALSGTE